MAGSIAALVMAMMTVVSPPASAATWSPPAGPVFNNPTGNATQRNYIIHRINNSIRYARAGSYIRFVTYNLDRTDTIKHLIAAHKRGVHVQILVNDNLISNGERTLQRQLGGNRSRPSFLYICKGACRGSSKGNLHIKIHSFTHVGNKRNILINSSGNLGGGAAGGQWNDAQTVYASTSLWKTWLRMFKELKADKKASPRYVSWAGGSTSVGFQRTRPGATSDEIYARGSGDRVIDRLRKVGCKAPKGYGSKGKTVLRVHMYAWYARRGERIADELVRLKKRGCVVRVIGSVTSDPVYRKLRKVGIPARDAAWDWGKKKSTSGDKIVYGSRCYSHYKWMSVNGAFGGKGTFSVWTGSENWSPPSFSNDEVTFRFTSKSYYQSYTSRFNKMWDSKRATHKIYKEPKSRPCAT
ncbi:hypothetical protein J2S40_002761 [Nocardioides luteus]|uniref:phospholipase D n=1 Tax=Nocardioides luteus TaxID=1844 RepID=A0ABQ5SVE5_9ACTN|nr:phospholipase D-like domain-containing protein [Nocardioides luteus]MDR7311703.1 hypothetical protein [Nocardioides luteus]GGR66525.1 hypothetical protein GCM10010197_37670 [Nocardioides luteus]GLJ67944.1 hypothetical protein GCM10017579_19800 [Nocardioides luteus]